MTRADKLARVVLFARSDANIDFDDVRKLLITLGFSERIRGGHHIFVKDSVNTPNHIKSGKYA